MPWRDAAGTLLTYGWPLPALVATHSATGGSRSFYLAGFFTLLLLWPVTVAVRRLAGETAGAAAATLCAALHLAQLVLPPPVAEVQPNVLDRHFTSPMEAMRHTLRLPIGERSWEQLWLRVPVPEAYLYFNVQIGLDAPDLALTVRLGDRELGRLSRQTVALEVTRTATHRADWHRLPVTRSDISVSPQLDIVIRPAPDAPFAPGEIGLGGSYSYRPSFPPAPSAFFDGVSWSSDPRVLFPELVVAEGAWRDPGPRRFYVELRLIDPITRHFVAIYY